MFGAFKSTLAAQGGYLWKKAPRLSMPQKSRLKQRMRLVDQNIDVLYQSLKAAGEETTNCKKIDALYFNLPREKDMVARDKYTTFDKKVKGYRKSVHLVPKWTRTTFRENPKYF
ncbi:mitochondrial ribosomal protein L31 [Metschnikowia bicuspidata var. bicuspidata NRRL YB-4993]|uniref:Large ribosomal subunit protein mL60 n=1 Tax=Metschnikowia bicuspidata var. bicuspidata NRRL YB-4993 TaxID=869754 RepID=A0A1A0HG42_9ASCO|nr:mitochondrial ribosomal protein L31 [Metschnikowia bicuspidata var. bicuspidata NRRL YB-4993]OBA23129.1 mitochondrial ribosomal protein L31 [Metschnikowia bicuspidata var. bicuspidata NRRL YB-4993]